MSKSRIEEGSADRRFANTLARGLSVLQAFHPSDDGLGNAEISSRTGLPNSTISRLTVTSQQMGYLTHSRRHEVYRPGLALLMLGQVADTSISFIEMSGPLMQSLADETNTLCTLLARDGKKLLIIKTWRPLQAASLWLEVRHRFPLNNTSSGYAFLAQLSGNQFDHVVADAEEDKGLTPERALEIRTSGRNQLATQGFVIADPAQYFSSEINAVSVPFQARDFAEPVLYTCGALAETLSLDRAQAEVGPKLRDTVAELGRLVGQGTSMPKGSI